MRVSSLTKAGLFLTLGAVLSLVWFAGVVRQQSDGLVLFLGLLSLGFVSASSLCLLLALARYIQSRHPRCQKRAAQVRLKVDGEYEARYSWSDRIVALALVAFFGGLTLLLWMRSGKPHVIVGCAILFGWTAFYAVHITGTCIRFTRQGFTARISWVRNVSEPYAAVQSISGKPGTLRVQFSDGQSLKFHSGLGNPDLVIACLRAKCPGSIQLES